MTDGHTRRNSMGVDYHVRHHTFARERQILLSIGHTTGTLLAVTRGEFITDLGNLYSSHLDFDKSFVLVIRGQDHLVDVAFLRVLQRNRLVFKLLLLALLTKILAATVKITENIVGHG